jgi:hypothetical protein
MGLFYVRSLLETSTGRTSPSKAEREVGPRGVDLPSSVWQFFESPVSTAA